jgi:hypothetical protein
MKNWIFSVHRGLLMKNQLRTSVSIFSGTLCIRLHSQYTLMLFFFLPRLPIPEGLPPVTPAYLDIHLGKLLQDYTLKGIPTLVHCRGGVGRAGVVACCWLIKLGVCGWMPEVQDGSKDVVDYVASVISFVRQRRNLKAVETFEQVQFLIDYVEFLRSNHLSVP